MSEKLKPCPFCGGDNLNTQYINAIYCMDCNGGIDLGAHSWDKSTFIEYRNEAWNTRVSLWISVNTPPKFNIKVLISVNIHDGDSNIVDTGYLNKNDNVWYYGHCCGNCDTLTPVSLDGHVEEWMPEPPTSSKP